MEFGLLWVPATLIAAAAQTARNATQRQLTATLGTLGATQVRFLFGLPFALVFLGLVRLVAGEQVPAMDRDFLLFATGGAVAQIVATALMLAAMRAKGFATVTAIIKTEPVLVALFGAIVLGDVVPVLGWAAIGVATAGVVLLTLAPGQSWREAGLGTIAIGVAAGAFFALAAVGFRGAILALSDGSFLMRATTTLVVGLAIQTLVLGGWLAVFDRAPLAGSVAAWRPSLAAGFLGALASQFWFIGFALTSAANVRTLALVEVLFAALVSRRLFAQRIISREAIGLGMVTAGVALLLFAHA